LVETSGDGGTATRPNRDTIERTFVATSIGWLTVSGVPIGLQGKFGSWQQNWPPQLTVTSASRRASARRGIGRSWPKPARTPAQPTGAGGSRQCGERGQRQLSWVELTWVLTYRTGRVRPGTVLGQVSLLQCSDPMRWAQRAGSLSASPLLQRGQMNRREFIFLGSAAAA
jgi:hypothetical protein